MDTVKQSSDTINKQLDSHPELKEALDAMARIVAVEDVKARALFDKAPVYCPA